MSKMKWAAVALAAAALILSMPKGISAMAAGTRYPLQEESNKDKLDDAKKDAAAIKAERKTAQQRLDSLKKDKADLEKYVQELDRNVLEVEEMIQTLEDSMTAKQAEILVVQEELSVYRQVQKEKQEAMKLRIQFMYENNETQYLEMLFQAESLVDFLKRSEYISEMIRYDRQQLEAYQQACQDVVDTETRLLAEYDELEALKEVNEASLQDLEQLVEAKNQEIKDFTDRINNAQQEVNEYTSSLKKQEDLIKQIEDAIRKEEQQNKVDANSGNIGVKFIWPIPDSTRITSRFGPRKAPVAGASNYHKGVDVGAPKGTPIIAAAGGTVVISTYHYSAGNYVMINHGNGVYTVYMHASKLLVEVGDKVKQGEKIALVGTTGYSTGNHLHFGVRINGIYYDPLNYVVVP